MSAPPPWRAKGERLILSVKATPQARRTGLGGVWHDAGGQGWQIVKVSAAPEGGAANEAIIAVLANALSIPKRAITLKRGDTARLKQFEIVCNTYELIATLERLREEEA